MLNERKTLASGKVMPWHLLSAEDMENGFVVGRSGEAQESGNTCHSLAGQRCGVCMGQCWSDASAPARRPGRPTIP